MSDNDNIVDNVENQIRIRGTESYLKNIFGCNFGEPNDMLFAGPLENNLKIIVDGTANSEQIFFNCLKGILGETRMANGGHRIIVIPKCEYLTEYVIKKHDEKYGENESIEITARSILAEIYSYKERLNKSVDNLNKKLVNLNKNLKEANNEPIETGKKRQTDSGCCFIS